MCQQTDIILFEKIVARFENIRENRFENN
jgi:hypothetical protein